MELLEKSTRIRIVAPSLYKLTKEKCLTNNPHQSNLFQSKFRPLQFSPPKKLLSNPLDLHPAITNFKRPELPSLSNENPLKKASKRSLSFTKEHEVETPTFYSNNNDHCEYKKEATRNTNTPEICSKPDTQSCSVSPERVILGTPLNNAAILVLEPIYSGGNCVVLFNYPPQCFKQSRINDRVKSQDDCRLFFHVSSLVHTYNCVVNAFLFAGFKQKDHDFNVLISGVPKIELIRELNTYQKINHFPASKQLGRKDCLWKNINCMRRKFGNDYEICPKSYLIPEDFEILESQMEKANKIWILKPANSSCGRGIKVIKNIAEVTKKNRSIVSKYISNPHIINGYKYDLRVYVCVTSYDPLKVYIYQDGLVRFATEQYATNKKSLKKRYIHLTNFSVNKKSKNFIKVQSDVQDGEGSKWSFFALRKKFSELKIDSEMIFSKIEDVIIKTLIAVEPHMISSLSCQKYRNSCFELYGFDILIDSELKPWLLEVNILPSLSSSSPMDKKIKTSLMCDIFTLIGIVPYKKSEIFQEKYAKNTYRNINSLINSNSLEDYILSEDDIQILLDCEEESFRTGNFKKIFPLKKNIDYYSNFFQVPRYNNILLWKHLKSPSNILNKYLKRQHPLTSV